VSSSARALRPSSCSRTDTGSHLLCFLISTFPLLPPEQLPSPNFSPSNPRLLVPPVSPPTRHNKDECANKQIMPLRPILVFIRTSRTIELVPVEQVLARHKSPLCSVSKTLVGVTVSHPAQSTILHFSAAFSRHWRSSFPPVVFPCTPPFLRVL